MINCFDVEETEEGTSNPRDFIFFWFPVYYLFFGINYSWNQHIYITRKKVINQLLPSTFLQPCAYYSLKYIPDKLKEVLERVHGKHKFGNQIRSVKHLSR